MLTDGGVVSGGAVPAVALTTVEDGLLPAAARARAASVCVPLPRPVVSQEYEYGEPVSSAPTGAPSSRNCTPTTPTLSEAFAVTVTAPLTVAALLGPVTLTVGGVVSPGAGLE